MMFSLITILYFGFAFWLGNGVFCVKQDKVVYGSIIDCISFSAIVFIAKIPTDLRAEGIYQFVAIMESILGWMLLGVIFNAVVRHTMRK